MSIFSTPFDTIAPTAPSVPTEGLKYLNTTDGSAYIFTSGAWVSHAPREAQWAWAIDQQRGYRSISGTWKEQYARLVRVSEFDTYGDAFNFADAASGKVEVDNDFTLTSNFEIPHGVKAVIGNGGEIDTANFDLIFTGQDVRCEGDTFFITSGTGRVLGTIGGDVCIDWWGTTSENTTDGATTNAGNYALAHMIQSSKPNGNVYCTKQNYYLKTPWIKPAAYYCPRIDGRGATLWYTDRALQIIGGSGYASNGVVENFDFEGDETTWGIEVLGQCWVKIRRCNFRTNAVAIICHNRDAGMFTEFVQWEDCSFACVQWWWHRRTSGNESQHGCGPRVENVCNDTTPNGPRIVVDETVQVYNAPMEFSCWPASATWPLIRSGANAYLMLHGTVNIENFAGGSAITLCSTASNRAHTLVGGFNGWGGPVFPGDLLLMDSMYIKNDGVVRGRRKGFEVLTTLPASGGTVAIKANTSSLSYLLDVFINAPNYFWQGLVQVNSDPFGGNDAKILATNNTGGVNYGSWGAPTFGWTGSGLIIANANYPANTQFEAGVTDIGRSFDT